MSKELSTARILQDQVEAMVSLEGVVQLDNEWVANGFENLALRHGALCVLGVDNDRSLLEDLHRIKSIGGDVTNQVNLAIPKQQENIQEKTCNKGFVISPCSFSFLVLFRVMIIGIMSFLSNDRGTMDHEPRIGYGV